MKPYSLLGCFDTVVLKLEFDLTSITIEPNPTINFKNDPGLREVGDGIE